MYRFDEAVAIVTGAGSGIGRATAERLAGEGAQVIAADIDEAGAVETAETIRAAGGAASGLRCDVTDEAAVAELLERTAEIYGPPTIAHNNAGVFDGEARLGELALEDWHRVVSINLTGVLHMLKYELPAMAEAGGGAIVNTASTAGLAGGGAPAPYTASKHGVVGLTNVAAVQYADAGIRVNCVCPGPIDTPLMDGADPGALESILDGVPMGRLGEPAEVAAAVAWLCSPEASFATGAAVRVDGGTLSTS